MRLAILGDIHANLEALQAVIEDAKAAGCSEYVSTGDVVGYNANPNECIEILRELGCPVVRGNHDEDGAGTHRLYGLNRKAHRSLMWTRDILSKSNRNWLDQLPYVLRPHGVTLVHASLDRPEHWTYVLKTSDALNSMAHQEDTVCFHGHTHMPIIYVASDDGLSTHDSDAAVTLQPMKRYLCNVGSVGKPRSKDTRAAYAVYDQAAQTITMRRVDYDREATQRKSLDAGLLDFN